MRCTVDFPAARCCPRCRRQLVRDPPGPPPRMFPAQLTHTPWTRPRRSLGVGTKAVDGCGPVTRPGRAGRSGSTRYAGFGARPRTGPLPRSWARHARPPARHGSAAQQQTTRPEPIPTSHHRLHRTAIEKPIRPNVKHHWTGVSRISRDYTCLCMTLLPNLANEIKAPTAAYPTSSRPRCRGRPSRHHDAARGPYGPCSVAARPAGQQVRRHSRRTPHQKNLRAHCDATRVKQAAKGFVLAQTAGSSYTTLIPAGPERHPSRSEARPPYRGAKTPKPTVTQHNIAPTAGWD